MDCPYYGHSPSQRWPHGTSFQTAIHSSLLILLFQVVKLHWYFKKGELADIDCTNATTAAFINTLGARELVSLSHDTFDFVDAINRVVAVEDFPQASLGLRPIDDTVYYTRNDFSLLRSWSSQQYSFFPDPVSSLNPVSLYFAHPSSRPFTARYAPTLATKTVTGLLTITPYAGVLVAAGGFT